MASPFANLIYATGLLSMDDDNKKSKTKTIKILNNHCEIQPPDIKNNIPCDATITKSGAHGVVYICNKGDFVFKQFNCKNEYTTVKANITKLFENEVFKNNKLQDHTCFNGIPVNEIFNDDNCTYKMIRCTEIKERGKDNITIIIKELLKKFNENGFIHGDIKYDNIMMYGDKYLLTDLDDMCHISYTTLDDNNIINLICNNTNEAMFTPLFVHPVYLYYRSFINSNTSTNNNTLNSKNSEFISDWNTILYTAFFNIQARNLRKNINLPVAISLFDLGIIKKNESDDQNNEIDIKKLYEILIYSDEFSFDMCVKLDKTNKEENVSYIPLQHQPSQGGGKKKKKNNNEIKAVKYHAIRLNIMPLRKEKINGKMYSVYKMGKRNIILHPYTQVPILLTVAKKQFNLLAL